MNERKPEDVMRALDILDKMDFFQGQRAGRELWFEKPFEVQEQDILDFSQGVGFVKNIITNSLALLREKDEELAIAKNERDEARRDCAMAERNHFESAQSVKDLLTELQKKDAEIEMLKEHQDTVTIVCERAKEHYHNLYENAKELFKATARAEAITEFTEKLMEKKCHYTETEHTFDFDGVTVDDIEQTAKEMKGETDGKTDL